MVVENAETAIAEACQMTGAIMENFTAGPIHFSSNNEGGHEWIIEFRKNPDSLERFGIILDETLRHINSDYDAKRFKDMALKKTHHPCRRNGYILQLDEEKRQTWRTKQSTQTSQRQRIFG